MKIDTLVQSDILSRTFRKQRGDYVAEMKFTTYHDVLKYDASTDNFSSLCLYLKNVFIHGYEEKLLGCSDAIELVGLDFKLIDDYQTIMLSQMSGYQGMGKKQHAILQDYFIENHSDVIACEIPVWDNERSGFIDLISFKDNKVYIMDFKPAPSHKNFKKVCTQLLYYKKLLCERTGIHKDDVICTYFNDEAVYQLIY